MKTVSGKDFCKVLESKGWVLKRVAGSHHIYGKEGRRERISVPVHKNTDLKLGLQRTLMKIAEISETELENRVVGSINSPDPHTTGHTGP